MHVDLDLWMDRWWPGVAFSRFESTTLLHLVFLGFLFALYSSTPPWTAEDINIFCCQIRSPTYSGRHGNKRPMPTSLLSANPCHLCKYPGRSTNVTLASTGTSSQVTVFLNFRAAGVLRIGRIVIPSVVFGVTSSLDWQKHFFLLNRVPRNLQNVTADRGDTEDPVRFQRRSLAPPPAASTIPCHTPITLGVPLILKSKSTICWPISKPQFTVPVPRQVVGREGSCPISRSRGYPYLKSVKKVRRHAARICSGIWE
jgi:hypothetical protein